MTQVFQRLQNALANTSEAKGAVAEYILENWQEAAFLTASRIALKVGVSESVVVRLAQDIDYSGFPDLQANLREAVRSQLSTVSSIDAVEADTATTTNEVVQRVLELSVKNLQGTCTTNSFESFQRAVELILGARRIAIVANRNAKGPAIILSVHLNEVLTNTLFIGADSDDLFDHLRPFNKEDLVIIISLPKYSRQTIQACKFVNERGIPHIAITDSISSPLAHGATLTLLTQYHSHGYGHSHLATVFIVDVITNLLLVQANGELSKSLEELDSLIRRYGYANYE